MKARIMQKPENPARQAFSQEELQTLKQKLPDNLIGNSILTMIGAGLRLGELLALAQTQIADDGSWIRVAATVTDSVTNPVLTVPKTMAAACKINVLPEYRDNVKRLKELGGTKYIWETDQRENKLYTHREFRQEYVRAMHSVTEVPYRSATVCRHTYKELCTTC